MSPKLSRVLLIFSNLLIPIAIAVFATGFFPYKPFLPGRAQYDVKGGDQFPATFDKVIFMVVDALRSDFVYSQNSGFQFTQAAIRRGDAIPFTAHATSPTITMPRVKAMTTGSVPSYLDVILNFAESDSTSNLARQDTWLSQLKGKPNGRLVMYGDDTWLKLFPGTFSRSDGTSSFFVSDFSEVDNNVTRHISSELYQNDWNGMILHYLGLDHIGHKSGPRSPNMGPKQVEMDNIVRTIFGAIEVEKHLQSTLLVLCGDHGMTDAGNHGGSAESETSPALVFFSPKLRRVSEPLLCPALPVEGTFQYYSTVEQSDIAPTLAGLLGFPIPLNNLGVFIPEFLRLLDQEAKIRIMQQNALQMLNIVKATFPEVSFDKLSNASNCVDSRSDGLILSCLWITAASMLDGGKTDDNTETIHTLTRFLRSAQDIVSGTASNYNVRRLYLGIGLAALALVSVSIPSYIDSLDPSAIRWQLFPLALVYGVMMFASSFVEEEQHFWLWTCRCWLSWQYIKANRPMQQGSKSKALALLALAVTLRILQRWNQTGQKYAGEPDIARAFLLNRNIVLWTLVTLTHANIAQSLARTCLPQAPRHIAFGIAVTLSLAALAFKVAYTHADAPELLTGFPTGLLKPILETSLIPQARGTYIFIAVTAILTIFPIFQRQKLNIPDSDLLGPLHDLLTLFLTVQSRITNVPLFLIFEVQAYALGSLDLSWVEVTIASIVFQRVSFFALGGSNSISSIDLSNAYNGINSYNVMAVGVLTFCSNWAGPLWWTVSTSRLLLKRSQETRQNKMTYHLLVKSAFTVCSLLFVMVACTMLRTHLFVWTVFSPKYLYSMAWSLGQHLCVDMIFGTVLFWLGSLYKDRLLNRGKGGTTTKLA